MSEIKYIIPQGTKPSHCRGCGAVIYWVKTRSGANMCVEEGGIPHWANCPASKSFRKPKK